MSIKAITEELVALGHTDLANHVIASDLSNDGLKKVIGMILEQLPQFKEAILDTDYNTEDLNIIENEVNKFIDQIASEAKRTFVAWPKSKTKAVTGPPESPRPGHVLYEIEIPEDEISDFLHYCDQKDYGYREI